MKARAFRASRPGLFRFRNGSPWFWCAVLPLYVWLTAATALSAAPTTPTGAPHWGSARGSVGPVAWSTSGYQVHLQLAVFSRANSPGKWEKDLKKKIQQRLQATNYPLWRTRITLAQGPWKHQLLSRMHDLSSDQLPDRLEAPNNLATCIKKLYLGVRETTAGYRLTCREYDATVYRWGAVQERTVRQRHLLGEACLELLRATFAPLAIVRPQAAGEVLLYFKGHAVLRQTNENLFYQPGDLYQPLLVRTNRAGEILPDGVRELPWTSITLVRDFTAGAVGQVHASQRNPWGVRRRGRMEYLAVGQRYVPGHTRVRFHARHDVAQGLSGYRVSLANFADQSSRLLGYTNAHGEISVPPSGRQVQALWLGSADQVLAKIPIAPGAYAELTVPVVDDLARLQAQTVLLALQEKLTDLVARRQILIARIRQAMETDQWEEARVLLRQLDDLPGRAQFDQQISSAENNPRHRSTDPQVQARIERLFAETRKLLGKFLSSQEISQLRQELSAARQQ